MLISCPSCPRTYRVPASAIPPEGREVTCTACGEVWFEHGIEAEVIGVGGGSMPVSRGRDVALRETPPDPSPALVAPKVADIVTGADYGPPQVTLWQKSIRTAFDDTAVPGPAPENDNEAAPELEGVRLPSDIMQAMKRWWDSLGVDQFEDRVFDWARKHLRRPQEVRPAGQTAASRVRRQARAQLRNRLTYPRIAGWTLWVSAVAALGVVICDPALMQKIWPRTAHVYDAVLGAPVAARPMELAGVTSRLAESIDGPVLEVRGRVINRSMGPVMPMLTLTVAGEKLPHRETVAISEAVIPSGGERPFVLRANMPSGAKRAGLTLVEGNAIPATGEDGFFMQRQGSGWGWSSPPPSVSASPAP